MKLIVCGRSEDGRFIGLPSASPGYSVFTALEPDVAGPGDLLSCVSWDEDEEATPPAKNLKTGAEFPVRIEGSGLSLDQAKRMVAGGVVWHPPWPG